MFTDFHSAHYVRHAQVVLPLTTRCLVQTQSNPGVYSIYAASMDIVFSIAVPPMKNKFQYSVLAFIVVK